MGNNATAGSFEPHNGKTNGEFDHHDEKVNLDRRRSSHIEHIQNMKANTSAKCVFLSLVTSSSRVSPV